MHVLELSKHCVLCMVCSWPTSKACITSNVLHLCFHLLTAGRSVIGNHPGSAGSGLRLLQDYDITCCVTTAGSWLICVGTTICY